MRSFEQFRQGYDEEGIEYVVRNFEEPSIHRDLINPHPEATSHCTSVALSTNSILAGGDNWTMSIDYARATSGLDKRQLLDFNLAYLEAGGVGNRALNGDELFEEMLKRGDGSRALLFIKGADDVPGHVVNVVNVGGTVKFLDGQAGKTFDTLDELLEGRPFTDMILTDPMDKFVAPGVLPDFEIADSADQLILGGFRRTDQEINTAKTELLQFAGNPPQCMPQGLKENIELLLNRPDLDGALPDVARAIRQGSPVDLESVNNVVSKLNGKPELDNSVLAELAQANRVADMGVADQSTILIHRTGEVHVLSPSTTVNIRPVKDADVLYVRLGENGQEIVHIDEVKETVNALRNKELADPEQLKNLINWRKDADVPGSREVGIAIDSTGDWTELFYKRPNESSHTLMQLTGDKIPLQLGDYSLDLPHMERLVKVEADLNAAYKNVLKSNADWNKLYDAIREAEDTFLDANNLKYFDENILSSDTLERLQHMTTADEFVHELKVLING